MPVSAGNPVRLDPFQNIVGVSWPGVPIVAAITEAFVNHEASSLPPPGGPLSLDLPTVGVGPAAAVGDLLIANVGYAAGGNPQLPTNTVVLSPPAGWTELYQEEVRIQFNALPATKNLIQVSGLWSRYLQAADLEPDSGDDAAHFEWTHDDTQDGPQTGVMVRVSGAQTSGFPVAWSKYVDDGGPEDPLSAPTNDPKLDCILPSIDPGGLNRLLLTFANRAGFLATEGSKWPGEGQTVISTVETDSGTGRDTWQRTYSEAWLGPEVTGTRTLTSEPVGSRPIAGMVAIR